MTHPTARISARRLSDLHRLLQKRRTKSKTSLSISAELIEATDILAGRSGRSGFVQRALKLYLKLTLRRAREDRDRQLIDARAAITNRESDRLLELQAWPE